MAEFGEPRVFDANRRLHEEWFRQYLETLSPAEREAEIAHLGWLWRYIEPRLLEAYGREVSAP